MASKKRKQTSSSRDIRAYLGKENVSPEDTCSPPKKKSRGPPGLQTQTRPPLGTGDPNAGSSQQFRPRAPSTYRCVKEERISDEDEPSKAPLVKDSPASLSPFTEKVDRYFPKTYKTHSPIRNEGMLEMLTHRESVRCPPEAAEPQACDNQALEITEALYNFKLDSPKNWIEDFHGVLEEIGRSVCRIAGFGILQGTGIALCDWLIVTNAHLFPGCMDGRRLLDPKYASVVFELEGRKLSCTVERIFVDIDENLDYAVVSVIPEELTAEFPPGLLKRLGPVPESGRIGLVGYPEGQGKTIKTTSIIKAENRKRGLPSSSDCTFSFDPSNRALKINDLMMGGSKEKDVITYCSSMYLGTSGSPVVDEHGHLIGIHTGGYKYPNQSKTWAMEYAYKLPLIFKNFVRNLKKNGEYQLLERLRVEALGNEFVMGLLQYAE